MANEKDHHQHGNKDKSHVFEEEVLGENTSSKNMDKRFAYVIELKFHFLIIYLISFGYAF